MEEEADDPIERLTEMSFVSETSHEDGFSQSPVLLSCLSLIMRSSSKDYATSTGASEKGSPIIPLQFGISGLSQPTGDLNFTPQEPPDGCSQERHSDYNPETSQSLFTSIGTTVAEENTGGGDLNPCDGDGTTRPLEDSAFSQTMFEFSQESLLAEPEEENTEVEEALHHTINTLCERLSATTEDNSDPHSPTLTANPDNTDSMETVQAVLTDITHQSIPTASSHNDVVEEDNIVRSLVKPLSVENGARFEENKNNNFNVEGLTCDREKNVRITPDFTLPLESRQTDMSQCEENYLLRDDDMHYPSENLFSKISERPKLNCNDVEEKCDHELAYKHFPRKEDSGKALSVSNDRPPDSRHDLQTEPTAVSGTHTGQTVVNGESTSCKAIAEVIKKNSTENCTFSTSSESSEQVGRYPQAKKTTYKFRVPYNTKNNVNMNASSTAEQADHTLGFESQNTAIATAVPTDTTAPKNPDADTQNDCLGINDGDSSTCSNKSEIHHVQRENRTSFLTEKEDIDTCPAPKKRSVLPKDRPSNTNENTSTEQAENTHQNKYKDCDSNRDKRDNIQSERESDKTREFIRKRDNLAVCGVTTDGKDQQKSENNPRICEYKSSRHSGTSQDVNGDSATELEEDKRYDNEKIVTTDRQEDVQLIPRTEFQGSDKESASACDSFRQQGQPDFTPTQRLPPNNGTTEQSEETTGQKFQTILGRVRGISSTVMKHQTMDHGRELALLKRCRQLYQEVSGLSSPLSAEEISDLTDTAEIVIRDINKRQGEEKATLAERVKRGKMTSSEKVATKQGLQQLTERCTALQTVFKIHRELKRMIGDKADSDQQTQPPKAGSNNKATERCGSPRRRQLRKQETQTSSSVQHATGLQPGTQSVNTKSRTDQNLTNNIPRNEISASRRPETDGGKKVPCKIIPYKSRGAQSSQISTGTTCIAGTLKNQETSKVVIRDSDGAENSSQMSQSILQPIPKTNPLSTSSTSKPHMARSNPKESCRNESSGLKIKLILESELETPESTSVDNLQNLRSPQELNSQETRGTKALSKSDSDENLKLHTDCLVTSPQTPSSEQCLQHFSQSSSQKRKELSPLVSSTAKNTWLPDVLSSRAEDDKDNCDKGAVPCFEDGRRQPYVDKKCRGLHKMVVETQEVDMDIDEHMLSPVHSGQVSTTVGDQEKENAPVSEIHELATATVSPYNPQHTVDVVTIPTGSANPGAEPESSPSQPMSPDSTLPSECGSMSPVSSSKSLSVLQNPIYMKPSTLLHHSSPERQDSPKNIADCSAVENSTERNDDQQHNASSTQNTGSSRIMTRAQSNDAVENKTTSMEYFSSCRKRSRNVSASEETDSSDSEVIVHVSPKPKCRKTDQEIDANRQKLSFMPSSDVKGKTAVTGPVKSSDNAPQKNEIKATSSSQNRQMHEDTMSTQTNVEEYSDLFQKKIENNIPNVTFGTAAHHTQSKGLGARITEQKEQIVSTLSSDASDGQMSQPIQIVQVKQAQVKQPVAHGNIKSLISHKTVPDLSKNSGPQPSQNATLKPPHTVVVITGRNPSTVQRDLRKSTVQSVATPQRGSSPSSSMTSMTGIFPVSSQEILRKMAQDTTKRAQEVGLKLPSRNEPTTTLEGSRSTSLCDDKGSAGVSAVQIYSEQGKVSKIGHRPGDKISLDTARKESTQTPAVWQSGPKQLPPGTQVMVMKKLPQGKAPLGSVPGSQKGPKPLFHHLLHAGVFQPGTLSLSFSFNGSEKKASILEDGRIQDATNLIFSSPLNWFRAVTGLTHAKRHAAYSQILYRGSTLEEISIQASPHHQATHPPPLSNSLTTTLPQPSVKAVLPGNIQSASNPHPMNRPAESTQLIHDKNLSGSSQPGQENSSDNPRRNPLSRSEHLPASRPMETQSLSAPAQTRSASQSAPFLSNAGPRSNSEAVACDSSSKLIASLRKVKLIEEQEVVPHASCAELESFWSEDFAQVTMSPGFWATVDDWE